MNETRILRHDFRQHGEAVTERALLIALSVANGQTLGQPRYWAGEYYGMP